MDGTDDKVKRWEVSSRRPVAFDMAPLWCCFRLRSANARRCKVSPSFFGILRGVVSVQVVGGVIRESRPQSKRSHLLMKVVREKGSFR